MPKKLLAFMLEFLCLQKFTRIKLFIFLAKILLSKIFGKKRKSKKLTAENIFIFFRLIADMNKPSRKRG